ncbi:MAG: c-type cytochrome [Acidobacteriota bacterium]|nr:c-type cytochrome [Acidobacteriota bacterium]
MANPQVTQGKKVFDDQGGGTCHGEAAVGTAIAPMLVCVVKKPGADNVAEVIHNPPSAISKAGMPSFNLPQAQMKALMAYLASLY